MAQYRTDIRKIDSGQVLTRYEVNGLMESITPSGTHVDAYGKIRVSQQYQLFTSNRTGVPQYKFNALTSGTANVAFRPIENSIGLTIGDASGDSIIRESTQVVPFQPGKSLLVLMSFAMDTPKENLVQRVGYYDSNNGIYFENDGVTDNFVLRTNSSGVVVETRIPRAEWCVDKFDGTGYSSQPCRMDGVVDPTKVNIVWFDTASFTARSIRMGFVVNNRPYMANIFFPPDTPGIAILGTLTLPLRYEIKNVGATSGPSLLRQYNIAVSSEGGYELNGLNDGVSRGYTIAEAYSLTTAGTEYPLLSYRLKADRRNNVVLPNRFHIYPDSNALTSYRVWVGAKVTGGTWETNAPERHVEYNRSFTGWVTTGGRVVQGGFAVGGEAIQSLAQLTNFNYSLGRFLDGTTQEVILTVIPAQPNIKVLVKTDWIEYV